MREKIILAWTLIVLAAIASAADLSDADLADVPQCGLRCLVDTVPEQSSCSVTDFPCVCASAVLSKELESCFSTRCSPRDALTTAKIVNDRCDAPRWNMPLVNVIFATLFYLLRLLSRAVLHQKIDIGDVTLGISVAFSVPVLYVAFRLAEYGLGQDAWTIPQDNITQILHLYWWAEIFYQAQLPLTRISILCFYLKVFPQEHMRLASFALIGLNVANLIAFVVASVFQCYPIHGAWTYWDGSFDGHCNNVNVQSWVQAGFNISLDLLVIILPLPSLARLTASRRKKIHILIMFSFGFLVTIISIVRLKSLAVFANSTNISHDYVELGLYSVIEASIGIICGCLPAAKALLSKLKPNSFASTANRSGFSSGNGTNDASSRQILSRLEDAYDSSADVNSPANAKEEWPIRSSDKFLDSKSESYVELVPMRIQPGSFRSEDGREEKEVEATPFRNWSRPLPRRREGDISQ
ncbi:hypothetical protein F4802DRAFT_595819 [Xylaria palmicola]|nr:hypothetical protein F4802DRAFT_595819 [Xylaria palmicola]